MYGSLGEDTLLAGTGVGHLIGGQGSDSLDALDGVADDSVRGGADSDTCSADPGDSVDGCP